MKNLIALLSIITLFSCSEDVVPQFIQITPYEIQSQTSQIGDGSMMVGTWRVTQLQFDNYNSVDTLYASMELVFGKNGTVVVNGSKVDGQGVWQSDPNNNQLFVAGLPLVFNTNHRLNEERDQGNPAWFIFNDNNQLVIFDNNDREKFILTKAN
ncbi:hypothetical protein [Persicobacter psychrovividus]|uniref:META domain-containing protein n=1 Tax=Persicobacter psychrovividus TaxID=387638 RepID=A0ABM7VE12_9BACT|nr:hypothetical protein PEPS_11850 [Persicobacter psychrovividus]